MSGFQFPPPPPPPPKASWSPDSHTQSSIPSRGRGGGRGRERGSDGAGRGRGRGGRGGRSGGGSSSLPQHSPPPFRPQQVPSINGLPPGAYINPAFQGNLNPQPQDLFNAGIPSPATQSPARTLAGHKRKLDVLRGPPPPETKTTTNPTAPSVPSFGAPFGLNSSLPSPRVLNQNVQRPAQVKRASNALGLTPHGEPQYSSSESDGDDEDVDEEAMFAEVGTSLTFEHNGTVLSLNSAADLAAWKEERARNFPTQSRMAAKLEEKRQMGGERKRLLFEASKALRQARRPPQPVLPPESKLEQARKELDAKTESLDALRKKVAKSQARAALEKANASDVQAAEAKAQAETMGLSTAVPVPISPPAGQHEMRQSQDVAMNDVPDHLNDHEVDDESAQSSSSSESSVISSDSSDSDDDGPPEEVSSKQSKEIPGTKKILCRDYVASGRCRDGDSCRFKHELPERGTGSAYREIAQKEQQEKERQRKAENDAHDAKLMESLVYDRKTIFQRLVEQEHVGEDLLALQVIKALGKMKFFAESAVAVQHVQEGSSG